MDFTYLIDNLLEGLELPVSYFFNPQKRIYILYLISSTFLAYYIYSKSKGNFSFFKYLFNRKIWLTKSAGIDYILIFFNGFIKILLIAPFLIYGLYLSVYVNEFLLRNIGYYYFSLSKSQTVIFYTISLILFGDFTSYLVHYLMHKVPLLWEFHKVHHSATSLNPITQYRIHPIELLIINLRAVFSFGIITGIFDYLSDHQLNIITILGVNAFSFVFLLFGANLRHSHVQFKYPNFLEYFFVSPFQHQIHHSNNPSHFNKNLGSVLAVWDWLFGTLILSKSVNKIKFGLGTDDVDFNTFWKNLFVPFRNIFNLIKSRLIK